MMRAMARTIVLDLAGQAALARDLAAGGVLVPDVCTLGEDVELVLRGGGDEVHLRAKCVWMNGDKGAGLQLDDCDATMKQRIAYMAGASGPGLDGVTEQTRSAPADPDVTEESAAVPADPDATEESSAAPADPDATHETTAAPDNDETIEEGGDDEKKKIALNVHERLRGLTLAQQLKVAHHGEVSERIVLEHMYGKNVWEALLRNPRLTGPEVARIARMGSLPRPMMEIIVGNGGWLQIPEVRRALLTNPRLGVDHITKILRLLPKHELKMAASQTAYPFGVRDVAKRLLKEQGIGT
jgi:hypothetical protein